MLTAIDCPLCGESSKFLAVKNPYPDDHLADYRGLYGDLTKSEWKVCGTCGFVHQNPRPSTEALNAHYAAGDYHGSTPPPLAWQRSGPYLKFARWYYGDKVRYAIDHAGGKPGRVFEMGFGYGGSLRLFADMGWEVDGREPDARLAAFARDVLELRQPSRGFVDASIAGTAPVDLVFSNHAFEHVADLHGVMKALRSIMKPGGYIFTAVPTYAANRSNMSLQWMNSGHYSMFTRSSLDQMMARHGFEAVTGTYRGWRKEIDDVWHVARYTGGDIDATQYYEDSASVARFINVINPLRSLVFAPLFSNYAKRVQRVEYVKEVSQLLIRRLLGRPRQD